LAVIATVGPNDYVAVHLVCCDDCLQQVRKELTAVGANSETLGANATDGLLRSGEIVAVCEAWAEGDIRWHAFFTGTLALRRARSLIAVIQ
jgi:hypothetical protein